MKKFLAIFLLMPIIAFSASKKLYIFNWSEYMPDEVIAKFQKETGIKVVYSTYDSNEAMYTKLKIVKGDYDLAFPSTYYVNRMRQEGMLEKIDYSKISNMKNLDTALLNKSYDKGNKFSVPYLWGSTGLAINTKIFPESELNSFKDLWKPKFKGQILLTNDMREVFGVGLLALGYSSNSTNPKEIKAAYEYLKKLVPNVRVFTSEALKEPFINQEVAVGVIWNGEAFVAEQEDPNIKYKYPSEGAILWMDSMVIPKGAKNVDAAHKFINFILRPDIAKIIAEEIGYATPNKVAFKMLDKNLRDNKTVYPDEKTIKKGEFQLSVGEANAIYEKYWSMLKTSH